MSDIRRWDAEDMYTFEDPINGQFVTYADHVEALAQAANNQAGDAAVTGYDRGYEQGQRDALAEAVQRVEALRGYTDDFGDKWLYPDEVIAAIKGGTE